MSKGCELWETIHKWTEPRDYPSLLNADDVQDMLEEEEPSRTQSSLQGRLFQAQNANVVRELAKKQDRGLEKTAAQR